MSEIDDYELEALYTADPEGVTTAMIAAAASQAAGEVAALHNTRLEDDFSRVRQGQAQSAGFIAQGELERKYGKAEVENLLPKIRAKLDENPSLISDDALTSPTTLAHQLDDVLKIVQAEAKVEADANQWQAIKAANTNLPRF